MSRKCLRVIVDLNIEAVSCPGAFLKERQDVYLSIVLLGYQKRTLCLPPYFPLLFHQKFRFERTFLNCGDPAHLAYLLQFENILIELIQLDEDYSREGTVLAHYQASVRDFLYPGDTLVPSYAVTDRELLMRKNIWFSGISPKLEFSCKTSVQDTSTPMLDYYRDRVAERSDPEVEVITVTPTKRSGRKKKRRTKSYEAPTISSAIKSSRLGYTGIEDRPPFIVKRKDSHNRATSPSRASSPSPRRPASAPPTKPRTPISFRTGPPTITGSTTEYISEANCRLCRIYQRYYGRRYWGHKKYYHPNNGVKIKTFEPIRNTKQDEELEKILNRGSAPATESSDSTEDILDSINGLSLSTPPPIPGPDVEYARLPYSPRLSRSRSRSRSISPLRRRSPRSRSLSPVLMKSPLRERVGSRPGSPTQADLIHSRVTRALANNYLSDDSDRDSVTSEEALNALHSSLGSLRSSSLRSLDSTRYNSLY